MEKPKKHLAKIHRGYKKTHYHVAQRPHQYMMAKNKLYWRWHSWRWHPHVHVSGTAIGIVVLGMVISSVAQTSLALSTWTQTDWSGGTGTSTTNQFSSASNMVTSASGQATLAKQEMQTNGGFDTNLSSWVTDFEPSSYGSLVGWYKADAITGLSDGQAVSSWSDSSSGGYTATQGTGTNQPLYKTNIINGKPVVRFDNTNDYLSTSLIPPTGPAGRTIVSVTLNNAQSNAWGAGYIYSYGTATNGGMYALANLVGGTTYFNNQYWNSGLTSTQTTTGSFIISQQYNGTADYMYANGNQVGSFTFTPATGSGSLRIGARISTLTAYAGVDLAELMVFNTNLTTDQLRSIETYLYRKYNVSIANTYDPMTRDTGTTYGSSAGSAKITSPVATTNMVQSINVGDTSTYNLEAYAYTNGGTITSADAELYYNGSTVSTTYTSVGGGWYKLSGSVTGANESRNYGVQVKSGKTVYIDDFSVYKYQTSGTLTSAIYDLNYGGDWGTLTYSSSGTGTVTVKVRTSNDSGMSGAPAFSGCSGITSSTDLTGQSCVTDDHRYIQYEITLAPPGGNGSTPIFEDISIQYDPYDQVDPSSNASSLTMEKINGGSSVASNGWTNQQSAYFEWTAGADSGSGLKGYCAYLGTSGSADPVSTKGLLGNSPVTTNGYCPFIVSGTSLDLATITGGTSMTSSSSPYYLHLKAVDLAGNIYNSNVSFQFRFDNTVPSNPAYITAPSQFLNTKTATITWPSSGGDAPSDAHSAVAGLQYRIGSTTWYGDSHSGTEDQTDLLTNDGSYTTQNSPDFANIQEGNNTVAIRTWDDAGNVSTAYVTAVLKINTTNAPSSPQNVTATPSTNTTNSFAFSWIAPTTYLGSDSNITYCYTINTAPTSLNCTWTSAGQLSLTAGAYATQPGDNTFYVVAKDEGGIVNYATAASTTFTANTSAPGIPLNPDVADISVKTTSNWRLALSWEVPTDVGAGVSSYRVYRSTDNSSYSQIASTSGTSYVDTGLSQVDYYYKIKACDSANNCGAYSEMVSKKPTGKFTTPANIVSQPRVEGISTKKASVRWTTDRDSDSRIAIGTTSGTYDPFQVASGTQTTDHLVSLSNLTPGTTYFAKAYWTDEDGNIGSSSEFSFKTEPAPTTKDITTTKVTVSTAQIRFTTKNAASVKIVYGKSDSFGGQKELQTSLTESVYDVELVGLDDGTKYFFKLNTTDADGNLYESGTILTFTTPPRPKIENLRIQPIEGEPSSTQKITWDTNVPASSELSYGIVNESSSDIADTKLATSHEIVLKDLRDDSSYSLTARSRDAGGNLAVSDNQAFKTAQDTRPPKIKDITVEHTIRGSGKEARGQIVVSWKTDEPSSSQVEYTEGSNATSFRNKTSVDGELSTEHLVIVSDLPTSAVYSVRPVSSDKAGNSTPGKNQSVIIGRASDSVLTIILNKIQSIFGF